MTKSINEIDHVYDRLTVLRRAESTHVGQSRWVCKCVCGSEIVTTGGHLRSGHTRSCGCITTELLLLPLGEAAFRAKYRVYETQARYRDLEWKISQSEFRAVTAQPCYYCGSEPYNISTTYSENGSFIYSGIDRQDNTQGYTISNIVPCCIRCNRAKGQDNIIEFMSWAEKLYLHSVRQ